MYLLSFLFLGNFTIVFTFNVKLNVDHIKVITRDNFRKEVLVRESERENTSYFGHDLQMFVDKLGEK